jgi:SNF2 family DNA or RNA helicase
MHCVVFTHNKGGHAMIKNALKIAGFLTSGFTSNDPPKKRSQSIRDFQESIKAVEEGRQIKGGARAKVFVATMKIGNVGITLTAATRVYLFEPCIDPATEVQAAGRIHRLGQTKNVLVK